MLMVHVNVTTECILLGKINIQSKRTTIAAVAALLLIGVIAFAMIKMIPSDTGNEQDEPLSIDAIRIQATGYADTGDIDRGLAVYDEQIEKQTDGENRRKLLIDKTQFATRYERYDEATAAGNQAVESGSDLSAALALAKAYEAKGDKTQALKYYQMLADAAQEDGEASGRDGNRWQLKVEELRS